MEALNWAEYDRARRRAKDSAEYRRNRRIVLSRPGLTCTRCGRRIDLRRRSPDPWSPVVDHITEVTAGGHPTALTNLQAMHRWCNEEKERARRAALEGRTPRPLRAPAARPLPTLPAIVGEEP